MLVSALLLGLIAVGAATGFIASTHASAFTRLRADAQTLAQQDENRLRGLNVDELSNLNQTLPVVTLDGAAFTVQESTSFVTDASGAPSCTNPSADYIKTTSTVTWSRMGTAAPVSASSILTPTVGTVDPTHGTLAASVINAAGAGIAGMSISISGPDSATAQTSATGCALFGDLPPGNYTVTATPPGGSYVDAQSGQPVSVTAPDTDPEVVTAGSTDPSPTQFQLDAGGSVVFSFTTAFPTTLGVNPSPAPTATAPAVVLFNTNMTSPSYRLCSAADATCPAVGAGDTSFPAAAWNGSLGRITATPLFPYTYAAYAGVCTSDEPTLFGGTDGSANVTTGTSTLTLPAMVVRLYSGTTTTPGSEIALTSPSHLVIKDTGCGMRYMGYTTTPPLVSTNQAVLPLKTAYGTGVNDTGLLKFPGMPYGNYTVCYDTGAGKTYQASAVQNKGTGEIIKLYKGSAVTASAC